MSAEVETMFSVRETPWHGMGTIIEAAPTSADALHLAGLDWRVEQTPAIAIINGNEAFTGATVNYRDSDGAVLGVVKSQYKICQNDEAFAFVDDIIGGGDVKFETAGSLFGGKVVWMLAQLPETNILGDDFKNYFLFANSHDGSRAVTATITPVRVVCNNTLNAALRGANRSWSFLHKGDISSKIAGAKVSIENARKYQLKLKAEAERLASRRIDIVRVMDMLFPEPPAEAGERRRNNVADMREGFLRAYNMDDLGNFRGTAWGALNAVSDLAYHAEPKRRTATFLDNRMAQAIKGNALLDKAYDLLAA